MYGTKKAYKVEALTSRIALRNSSSIVGAILPATPESIIPGGRLSTGGTGRKPVPGGLGSTIGTGAGPGVGRGG